MLTWLYLDKAAMFDGAGIINQHIDLCFIVKQRITQVFNVTQ